MHRAPYVNYLYNCIVLNCTPRILGIMNHDGGKRISVIPEFDTTLNHNWHKIQFTIEIL